ncbi:probable serine/threonine-protein kinase drkD isoform X3 [Pocillopora verrucosa]|uniref:probable serine/threonine-protein kinase drkD isoform X3 n=1 Tax=Pocillopora verrucosa TaxID=203993 RepID=UPI00333E862C
MATHFIGEVLSKPDFTFRCQFLGTTKVTNSPPQVEAFLKDMARTVGLKAGGQMPYCELCISRTRVWTKQKISRVREHSRQISRISFTTQDPDDKTVFGYVCRPVNPLENNNELYAFKSEEAEVIIKTLRKYIRPTTNIMTEAAGSLDEESKEHVQPATHLTSHRSPTSKDEVKQLQQGAHRNNGSVVTAKYVSDRKSSEIEEAMEVDMEKEMSSKDPSEKPYSHSHASALPRNDLAVNNGTGDSGIVSVENHYGMEVGSMVEIPMADGVTKYGVIRWMGNIPQVKEKVVAGLELEVKESACSDGTFNKERLFTCPAGRGLFVLLEHCRPDSRFANSPTTDVCLNAEKDRRLKEENERGGNVHRLVRELEEQVTHLQAELREKELRETSLHEQLKKKEQLEETSRKQSAEIEQQLTNLRDVTQQMTIVRGQLQEKNEETANLQNQATALRQQLEEKDQEMNELETTLSTAQDELREHQRQLRDVTQQMTIVRGQLQEKNEETANLQNQTTALRQQLKEKDQQMNELETTLSTGQDELGEYQRQQSPDWVISRDHIQLTGRFLGEGGWARVVEGKYCGCSVAVKQMHKLILSPYNRNLFEREMDIASKCRHPCLLQFIGATNDEGNPLFVTELMETSLRALLEQRALSEAEMSFISLDVARALNYLHQKQPSPIVHRDISSANVLLWRQGEHWRGKVSDYGTANFMQQTMTVAPGAIIYSAPEALTKNQTVKVDVYSFGVLLCEMCIRELPDPMRRDRQVVMVKNKLNRALIRKCLQLEPEARPSIQEIIDELEEPV